MRRNIPALSYGNHDRPDNFHHTGAGNDAHAAGNDAGAHSANFYVADNNNDNHTTGDADSNHNIDNNHECSPRNFNADGFDDSWL